MPRRKPVVAFTPTVLPAELASQLVVDAVPLGLQLGTKRSDIALPAWFEDPLPERDGTIYGTLAEPGDDNDDNGEYVFRYRATVSLTLAASRLTSSSIEYRVPDADYVKPAFEQALALLAPHGTPKVKRVAKKPKFSAAWELDGAHVHLGATRVVYPEYSSEPDAFQVSLSLSSDYGVTYADDAPPAWVDLAALAKACATRAVPEAACRDALAKVFAVPYAQNADADAIAAVERMYDAVVAEHADLRDVKRALLAACDWSRLDEESGRYIAHALAFATAEHWGRPGHVFRMTAYEIMRFVRLLDEADRAASAWRVVAAIEHDDAGAYAHVAAALAARRRTAPITAYDARLDYADRALRARMYGLVTEGLAPDERVMFVFGGERDARFAAAAEWLAREDGVTLPAPQRTPSNDAVAAWVALLRTVEVARPQLFGACIAKLVGEMSHSSPEALEETFAIVGQHGDTATGSTSRVGPYTITYKRGRPGYRGRITTKLHA